MKLKKKLFSILGASAVSLAAITTVVACAKKDSGGGQEEQEQEGLDIGVSYTGTTKKFVIGGNDADLTIEGFTITQPVLGGQEMRVTTSNPEVRVEAPIRPADTFSVKITLLNTPAELDKDYNFDLIFSFAEHGAKITSKRIAGFKVKYYVS
ncbi:MAG: hypothetical protein MJ200_02720 [Mycoplasmoidaceae bacterium]|nr:hypothetical protein [Mycoplasmoidaceae bacterium]